MQTWPSHHRPPNPSAKAGRKSKEFVKRNYPVLDYGAVEAATLVQSNIRFEWEPLISIRPAASRLRVTGALSVFPATKSPPIPQPSVTINQRADQGAHFLRTQFPEVDVSADVIRSHVMEDTLHAAELAEFDPFEGNILDIVAGPDREKYLVFPTGELGAELNMTPIVEDASGRTVIRPTVTPSRTFSTPIQQIASSSYSVTIDAISRDILIGVRTFGATSLVKLDPQTTPIGGVRDLTYFNSHDVGGASIVDVKIFSDDTPFEMLLANKRGGVYGCTLTGGQKTMVKLYPGPEPVPENAFWRIGRGARPAGCVVLSEKTMNHLDFRSNGLSPLYIEQSQDLLTSSEDYAQDGLIRLCSTSQVIWLDPRYPGKPLLGYRHHRQYDRTLQVSTLFIGGSPTTFLSSRRNGMLTIYDVSRHDDELMRVNDSPYGVLPCASYRRLTGLTFLRHEPRAFSVFRADERASVDCVQLDVSIPEDFGLLASVGVEESDTVKELKERAENMKTDMDIFGDREKVVTNLFPAYDRVFRVDAEQREGAEEEEAEELYGVMDRLPIFWQTNDIPSEYMLTSYDIAFRSHEDHNKSSRSDFTTGSLLNSTRGFRALVQDRFPTKELRKGVPWHYDIASIQKRIDPSLDLSTGARDLAESLHSFDLIKDDNRTALSLRRENNAREQLAVDLALSRDVYSPSPFAGPREINNNLETMTEALSLCGNDTDEPPEVEFGYLAPVVKEKDYYDRDRAAEEMEEEASTGKVSLPMGVRLLLKDWEVGTKAKDYIFQDPYNTMGDSGSCPTTHSVLQRVRQINMMPSMSQVMNSQRPPTIMSSQALGSGLGSASQPTAKQPPAVVQTQFPSVRPAGTFGTEPRRQLEPSSMTQSQASQDYSQQTDQYMASTQVLSGPHGGRPLMPKKKKRLDGF